MVQTHRGPLDPATVREVRALADAAEQHDGVEAIGEQSLLNLTAPSAGAPAADVVHVTARDDAERLVGYAQLDPGVATAELVVDPPARRRGVGTTLLAAVREEAARAGVDAPRVWAHGDLPAARALASRAGMSVVRELWKMSLDLTTGSAQTDGPGTDGAGTGHAAPSDVRVRPFVVGADEEAWLRVNARAFADHPEQGRITLDDLRARQGEPWFDAADFLLAEQAEAGPGDGDPSGDADLLAYAWMKIEPGSDEGELYVLGVDPDAQGRGLGRLLTARSLDHLTDRGLRRAVLYTEADNHAAVHTYTAAGFTVARSDVQYA